MNTWWPHWSPIPSYKNAIDSSLQMSAQFAETNIEETIHHAVSFTASNTYVGLPQMKAYNAINIRFQFRTFEPNGLIMYNAGKASDFIAVELIEGRIQYTLNLGYGPINIKNNAAESLADNKWHWVVIGRPSRFSMTDIKLPGTFFQDETGREGGVR